MDNSPSSYSREGLEELLKAFEALYKESFKMAKKNIKLMNSLKTVTLEKEPLGQRVTSMANEVASLYAERKISSNLKEEILR